MTTDQSLLATTVGIDVAKDKLDIAVLTDQQALKQVVANTAQGFVSLLAWFSHLRVDSAHVCLEATGSYSDAISRFLWEQGYLVSVLNPAVLVDYRKSKNIRRKNDQTDALLLASYAQENHPRPWYPLPDEVHHLRALLNSRDAILGMRVQERNRLKAGRLAPEIEPEVREHIHQLHLWQRKIEQRICDLLSSSCELAATWRHLQTIPGIGWYAAARFIAHLGDIRRFPRVGAVVSLAGLGLKQFESGRTLHCRPHLDRHGRTDLRSLMYLCAMSALRINPDLRAWEQELRTRGKPGKVVMVALTRKMLHIAYGVWKNQTDYDPALAFPKTPKHT